MNHREIAERLEEAYEASKKSYSDLSAETGIPRSMIQRYVSGATERIPIERLSKLCDALGLDVQELLGWTQPGTMKMKEDSGVVYRAMTPQQAVLFDAEKDLTAEEQAAVIAMITAMRSTRRD